MQPFINTMLDPVVNFGKVTVSTGYTYLDTVIVLNTGDGSKLPNPSTDGPFNLVWFNSSTYATSSDDPNVEIVRCTGRTGDTLTIDRGQEGTSASNKNTPTKTYKMILTITKKTITDIKTEYESGVSTHSALDTGVHGVGASYVESTAGSASKVGTHAAISSSVHGFDSSGNAPAQTHGISRHSGNIGTEANITFAATGGHAHTGTDSTKVDHINLDNKGSNTHTQIDTALTTSAGHIAASTAHGTTGEVVGIANIQTLTNKTITDSTNNVMAKSLKSATTTTDVSAATAPSGGQVLTATSSTVATWQSLSSIQGAVPTGTVLPYAGSTAPSGYLLCDGAAISRTTYTTLFSVISTTYGIGDGSTTFNIPDFGSRVIVGAGPAQGGLSARNRGDKAGEETHILTIAELAAHTHLQYAHTNTTGSGGPIGGSNNLNTNTGSTGGNTPHNNMQPFGVANYIIKT